MTRQTIGAFLATQRKALGYTQEEVADKIGISNRTLSKWETDRTMPDILSLPALAEVYGVNVDEILRGERLRQGEDAPPLSPEEQNKKDEQARQARRALQRRRLAKFRARICIAYGLAIFGAVLALFAVFWLLIMRIFLQIPVILGAASYIAALILIVALRVQAATESGEDEAALRASIEHSFCNALRACTILPILMLYAILTVALAAGNPFFIGLTCGGILLGAALALWLIAYFEQRRIADISDDGMRQAALHNKRLALILLLSAAGAIAACTGVCLILFLCDIQYGTFAAAVSIACAVIEPLALIASLVVWGLKRKKQRPAF